MQPYAREPEYLTALADGTLKQLNPFTGTEVWTVPGRGNRPLGIAHPDPRPLDPDAVIEDLPVGVQQRVEIIKALANDARYLVFDEPTAVLTPQETDRLFDVMRNMKADGKALVIITHKLHEVMAISDKVPMLLPMATRQTPARAMMALRISPMPVGTATLNHSLAWESSSSGRMPTAMPPASVAPRDAAAMTPPRPPQIPTMPAPASACATA